MAVIILPIYFELKTRRIIHRLLKTEDLTEELAQGSAAGSAEALEAGQEGSGGLAADSAAEAAHPFTGNAKTRDNVHIFL